MKHLFSAEGEAALAVLVPARTLYAFDFDGTLAPIVPRPDQARSPLPIARLLQALAARAPVMVLSGRARADLESRVPAAVQYRIGNHGNEGLADDARLHEVSAAWVAQLRARQQADAAAAQGVVIEDKGFTLSLHYRLARDRQAAARCIEGWIARLEPPPQVIGGKRVYNLLPPHALTKYDALAQVAAREAVDRVLFVGDDDTDELVFARAPRHWITVRVEFHRDSRAMYFLNQQAEVTLLLDRLVQRLNAAATRA